MKQEITKQTAEEIIDKLADKTLSFGCRVVDFSKNRTGIICGTSPKAPQTYYVKWENCYSPQDWDISSSNQVIGHPVYIGDVLARMDLAMKADAENTGSEELKDFWGEMWRQIMILWERCGFSKSLQQILSEAEWEAVGCGAGGAGVEIAKMEMCLKSPAKELFVLLCNLL